MVIAFRSYTMSSPMAFGSRMEATVKCSHCGRAQPLIYPSRFFPVRPFKLVSCRSCGKVFYVGRYRLMLVAALGFAASWGVHHAGMPKEAVQSIALPATVVLLLPIALLFVEIFWAAWLASRPLHCEECRRGMKYIEIGHGGITLTPDEAMRCIGPAEQCQLCGRAYCSDCYPSRANICACGRRALWLVKVRYGP
jgi:hypothetical protein